LDLPKVIVLLGGVAPHILDAEQFVAGRGFVEEARRAHRAGQPESFVGFEFFVGQFLQPIQNEQDVRLVNSKSQVFDGYLLGTIPEIPGEARASEFSATPHHHLPIFIVVGTPSRTLLEKAGQVEAIVASPGFVIVSVLAVVAFAVAHGSWSPVFF
jgi:hypothetical protein